MKRLSLLAALCALPGLACAAGKEPHATAVIESLALSAPTATGTLVLRITYPTPRGRYPVIVLSQGARSTPLMYARLAAHWAGRGHVVIQPVPPELSPIASDGQGASRLPATIQARIADIRFVLTALEQIEARARALQGKLDGERIAVAGHSTGALATLLAAGTSLVYDDGAAAPAGESSIDAVLLLGDPSRSGIVPQDAWRSLGKPAFLATGTDDAGELPASGGRPAVLFGSGRAPGSAPRHELFVRGMDVCLGGLLCRAAPGSIPDAAALWAIAEATSAFLAAYLRDDREAMHWLREGEASLANGRAKLGLR